jgi:hypothetical protein
MDIGQCRAQPDKVISWLHGNADKAGNAVEICGHFAGKDPLGEMPNK